MVDGLYSGWSPEIYTESIKVLTEPRDHQLTISEGCAITPPTLGRIGEFHVTFTTHRDSDKPPREIEPSYEDPPEGLVEKAQSPREVEPPSSADQAGDEVILERVQSLGEEAFLLQHAALKLAVRHMKYLSYTAWIIVALLVIMVLKK